MKNVDMDMHTQSLEMSGGLNGINYPQKFVKAKNPNKPGPTNEAAKHAPSLSAMMSTME